MIRKSFLRKIELQQLSIAEWDLPGIGTHKIGFGICPESGMIMQSPSPTIDEINTYYREVATYINPGREGKPSSIKTKDLSRLIHLCKDTIGFIPESVFQVGCSDGYTLKRFIDSGAIVAAGIDPSNASHALAKKLYNIETIIGPFEDYNDYSNKYDLLILTHVLEHLFNPLDTLRKCNNMQNNGGWILIEVPLFDRIDCFPPGLLTLEHLNYFSEGTIIETATRSDYEPIFIGKYYDRNEYPVITVIAKKNTNVEVMKSNDYPRSYKLLSDYMNNGKQSWKNVEEKIKQRVKKGSSVYIYGAGIHTSQLLAFTDIKDYLDILGLLDSSPTKWGKKIGTLNCYNKNTIDFKKDDTIVISSYSSEDEIYNSLLELKNNNVTVIKIYGD